MARYYIKPVFWNTENYRKPSGAKATSGHPADEGYGGEEWNNAPFMAFQDRGRRFRTFHTEPLGNAPVHENEGEIFLFLTASHDGVQQLVGVAGKSICLASDEHKPERVKLVQQLGIHSKWKDAWDLDVVKNANDQDLKRFMRSRNKSVHHIPNWKCPEDLFFWPTVAVGLDPIRITGKKRLLNMFSSYTEIGPDAAIRIMTSVPINARVPAWFAIFQEIDASFDDAMSDISDLQSQTNLGATTKQALVNARLGQGNYRLQLMKLWNNACAVTGCEQQAVLRASHIKPWRASSNPDRLNPRNGLLLSANLDALFDRGLISFDMNGEMLLSNELTQSSRKSLGLPGKLRRAPHDEEKKFLEYHFKFVFRV